MGSPGDRIATGVKQIQDPAKQYNAATKRRISSGPLPTIAKPLVTITSEPAGVVDRCS
jgi:hypothetical protein